MTHPIRYELDLSRSRQHLLDVVVHIPAGITAGARLVLPVWTPGSYVVRDYVHHLQRITAEDRDGGAVDLRADGRTAWLLPEDADGPVTVRLEIYGNELTVRTNHVDDHHALVIPAATFPFIEGATDRRHEVAVSAPDGWRVWSLLPGDANGSFAADDYDHLVDSAFEAGDHEERTFEVAGVPHRFVWAGHGGRPDLDRIVSDAAAIGEAAVDLFRGELPTEQYTYLCNAWHQGGGGLEHRDGSVLLMPAHSFRDREGYDRFQTLMAHEYVHLWNVKRLLPAALTEIDYENPVHTDSLWVAEGWTAYYDELLPLRAGVRETRRFLDSVGESVRGVLERPGRSLQSVRQASHEAWTKFYIRDENSPNVGVSYYEQGAVLAWCLDLLLRRHAPASAGLDDVMRLLWQRFGGTGRGYEEGDVEAAAAEVAGTDLSDFFTDHVAGLEEPPVEELLAVVGLRFRDEEDPDERPPPDLGVAISEDDDGITITSVLRDRPAWHAGLTGGDRLLAVGGSRVGRGELPKALRGYSPGETVEVAVFRGPRLLVERVVLGEPRPKRKLVRVEEPDEDQRGRFAAWTARALDEIET